MTKTLIIAEKPSVANDIAKTLGGFTKHDEYFESDDYVLSSAVGHLLEIAVPEEHDVKRGKWSFAHLPMIPPYFAQIKYNKLYTNISKINKYSNQK
jgi:DNA topoisomerase-3